MNIHNSTRAAETTRRHEGDDVLAAQPGVGHAACSFAQEVCRIAPWVVFEEDEGEYECRKLRYYAIHEDTGQVRDFDVSPLIQPRPDRPFFAAMIALDFPKSPADRPQGGLDHVDLEHLQNERLSRAAAAAGCVA